MSPPTAPGSSGSDVPARRTAALAHHREETIDRLCRDFAEDAFDMDELERRLDLAHAATSVEQLDRLVAGLPARQRTPAPAKAPETRVARPSGGESVAPVPGHRFGVIMSVFGSTARRGSWHPPAHVVSTAIMGSVELDFREAVLAGPHTRVTAVALMGGIEIIVPPDVRVETSGIALLGGFDHDDTRPEPPPEDAPVLHVDGLALMGGVSVSVRLPGESAKDARRRRRELRREARRELRQNRRLRRGD